MAIPGKGSVAVQASEGEITVEVGNASVLVEAQSPPVHVGVQSVLVEVSAAEPSVSVGAPLHQILVDSADASVEVDVVGRPGPPGSQGPQGDPGPQGEAGPPGADLHYFHHQGVPSKIWNVRHDMHRRPNVTTQDENGYLIFGSVTHISDDELYIQFKLSLTGIANCT